MEPIDSLAANDWFKDYDSLFEMFDEEMRTGAVEAAAMDDAVAASNTWPTNMSTGIGIAGATSGYEAATYYAAMAPPATPLSDYYYTAATFAASTPSATPATQPNYYCRATSTTPALDAYDLNNQYYSTNTNQYHHHVVPATSSTTAVAAAATSSAEAVPNTTSITSAGTPAANTTDSTTTTTVPTVKSSSGLIQPPDDLSLFLGLDWLPWLQNELPETGQEQQSVDVAPHEVPQPPQPPPATHATIPEYNNIGTTLVEPMVNTVSSCSSSSTASSPLSLYYENVPSNSATSSAYSSAAPSPTTISSSSPTCDGSNTLVCGLASVARQASNHDCNMTDTKRVATTKKKGIRSRGTSLLAQPASRAPSSTAVNVNQQLTSRLCAQIEHSYALAPRSSVVSGTNQEPATKVTDERKRILVQIPLFAGRDKAGRGLAIRVEMPGRGGRQ